MNSLSAGGFAVLGHGSSLLNMAGHSAGVLVFGTFLFLLARDRAGSRLRGNGLRFAAAGLALAWNLGALMLIALSPGWPGLVPAIELFSFCSLSLLAPVLLHLSLNHRCPLAVAGYLVGGAAVCLHLVEAILHRREFHAYSLVLMVAGFGSVTLVSAIHLARAGTSDRRTPVRQLLGTVFLLIFIGTYVHVGLEHGTHAWPTELILHHASIPLALLIILHNHRFVLLDALIRFGTNAIFAGLFTFVCLTLFQTASVSFAGESPALNQGLRILGLSALLLLFALARESLQRLLTRIVFRRGDPAAEAQELRSKAADLKEEPAYLSWALDRIALFMHSDRIQIGHGDLILKLQASGIVAPTLCVDVPELRRPLEDLRAEVVIPLCLSGSEVFFSLLGRRRGGQPYLSEDLRHLGQFATIVADQVQTFRESELRRLAVHAELRALQAQINPHFLFNALNTLYGLVPRQAEKAREMVVNLSNVFRYFLRNERTTIALEEELRIIEAYLEIETLRLGAKLRREIQVDPKALRIPILILSIQPLVENAVKHGVASNTEGGLVRLVVSLSPRGVNVLVEDTGAGEETDGPVLSTGAGIGLQNVARRLRLTYGPDADLRIERGPAGTAVSFTVPLAQEDTSTAAR